MVDEWQRDDRVSEHVEEGAENVAMDKGEGSASDDDDDDDDEDLTTDGVSVAVSSVRNEEKSNFGNIAVTRSKDVHFGNKTFYQGPVTIVYTQNKDAQEDELAPEFVSEDVFTKSSNFTRESPRKANDTAIIVNTDLKGFKDEPFNPPSANCLKSRYVGCVAASGVAIVLILTTIIVFLPTKNGTSLAPPTSSRPALSANKPGGETLTPSGKLRYVERDQWLAQPPNMREIDPLTTPVPYVIISHTATSNCTISSECKRRVRDIQVLHMEGNGWGDIAYNFLVGGDSYAYVGRRWDNVGAHSFGYNNCSIGISFIGTFIDEHPPERQMDTAKLLIAEGVRLGKIRADYRLIGHRQVSSTVSPGDALFADIKDLPHFSEKVVRCYGVIQDMDDELTLRPQDYRSNSTTE